MTRALFAALTLALAACAAPAPQAIYPEAELAPGQILAPIRAAFGGMAFTNAALVHEGLMEVEGRRADGTYKFFVVQAGDHWILAGAERTGPAP